MPVDPFAALGIDQSTLPPPPAATEGFPQPSQQKGSGGPDPFAALGVDTSQQFSPTQQSAAPTAQASSSPEQTAAWQRAGINPLPPSKDATTEAIRQAVAPVSDRTYGEILPLSRDSAGGLHAGIPNIVRRAIYGFTESPSEATTIDTSGNISVAPEVKGNVAFAATPMRFGGAPSAAAVKTGALDASANLPKNLDLLSPEMKLRAPAEPTAPVSETGVAPPQQPAIPPAPETAAAAKARASDYYATANSAGGTLSPSFTNKFIDAVGKIAPQTEEGLTVAGPTPITGLIQRMQGLRDQPISLQGAQEIDEALSGLIDKEYGLKGLSKDGRNLLNLQSTFRDMIANAGPSEVEGGTAGFDALSNARQAWAQAMKMGDLERIQTRAAMTDNPATSIKSGIRTLLSNPTRARGYSDAERAALEDAAERGVMGSVLHVFGSRLLPMAGAVLGHSEGGLAGAAVGGGLTHAATSLARAGAEALQSARLQSAANTIARGMPPPVGWRPPALQIQPPGLELGGVVPWRTLPQLAAPTQAPPTSRNPTTGLPEYSLEANQKAAAGDTATKLAGQMVDGSLADHGALNAYVNQNKRDLRAQFGGQGIQNIMKVGAMVRRATQEQTPSTVLSAILKGGNPDILSQVGNDPQSLIAKAITSPQLTQALAMKSKGTINKLGQNRIITLLGANDAPVPVDSNRSDTEVSVSPVLRGTANLGSAGANTGYSGPPQPPPTSKVAAPNRVGA